MISKVQVITSANVAHGEEPKNYKQAMASHAAECYELDQLAHLDTHKLTSLLPGGSCIGCHWVNKIKHHSNGNIVLYQACLVAQGFTQHPGEDFFKTFAPVAKIESIPLLLGIAAVLDWEIHVIDVNSAFLNSRMPEDQTIYLLNLLAMLLRTGWFCLEAGKSTLWSQAVWPSLVPEA